MSKIFLVVLTIFMLVACSKKEPATDATAQPEIKNPPNPVVIQQFLPLKVEEVKKETRKEKCKGKKCPVVSIEILRFPDNSALNQLVEKNLVALTQQLFNEGATTLESYTKSFLKQGENYYSSYLKATLLRQSGPLVLIRLDADTYTGGAHGIKATAFLNFDRQQNRALQLDDIIQDGKRPALITALQAVHEAWLIKNNATDPDTRKTWPFVETDNFALSESGVEFVYQSYAIAPYSSGQPSLTVPYAALKGILKPEWMLAGP